jgi:hypothetical protein
MIEDGTTPRTIPLLVAELAVLTEKASSITTATKVTVARSTRCLILNVRSLVKPFIRKNVDLSLRQEI